MTNKVQLTSIAVLFGALAMTGCAHQKAWSPELEQAREALQQVSSNPQVAQFAQAELNSAKRQLKVAEDASDYFKSVEVIAHESALAQLKAHEALETARAIAAKQDLRIAQVSGQQQQPIMAAATPAHGGSSFGGHSALESTETQQIAQQLAALGQQIAQLQSRLEGSQRSSHSAITTSAITNEVQANFEDNISLKAESFSEPTLAAAIAEPAQPELLSSPRLYEELRAMNALPSSRGVSLTLGERYFETDSARIWTGRAARHLDNIAAVMSENPSLVVDIEAHTDNTLSAEISNNLSSDRAISVKSALVLRGVNAARINATGYGDSAPIADNNSELGQLQNRRVEIIFPNVAAQ